MATFVSVHGHMGKEPAEEGGHTGPEGVDRRHFVRARSTRGDSQFARFRSVGAGPCVGSANDAQRLAICPAGAGSVKVGPSTAEGHYKLHNSLAAASVPPPYELASAQGQ
jgi:hypothetical protein